MRADKKLDKRGSLLSESRQFFEQTSDRRPGPAQSPGPLCLLCGAAAIYEGSCASRAVWDARSPEGLWARRPVDATPYRPCGSSTASDLAKESTGVAASSMADATAPQTTPEGDEYDEGEPLTATGKPYKRPTIVACVEAHPAPPHLQKAVL